MKKPLRLIFNTKVLKQKAQGQQAILEMAGNANGCSRTLTPAMHSCL
jgi:hypothetical protein